MDDTSKLTLITNTLTADIATLLALPPPAGGGTVQPAIDAATLALTNADVAVKAKIAAAGTGGGTPPAPGVPVITGASPASIAAGSTATVTFTGTGFTGATAIGGGAALSFANINVVSDTQLTADVTVAAGTAPGSQPIVIANAAGQSNALPFATS